jgi:centromeric protein E
MDVSNVDPEDVLVDFETVEPGDGDISAEIDEEWVRDALLEGDRENEEKVLVSVR